MKISKYLTRSCSEENGEWRCKKVNRLIKGVVWFAEVRFVNLLNLGEALSYLLVGKVNVSKNQIG